MRLPKIFLMVCVFVVAASAALAARGRPHVDSSLGYKVLLSDQNTLLRGVSLSWDGGDPYGSQQKNMPSQASLNDLREVYGLNTVHLFLEGDSTTNPNPIGYNAADCDTLVQRCAQANLYLIITIGCNGENGSINLSWSEAFWEFYAPRYANDTHVIYEAHNEPVSYTAGHWSQADWDNQVALYNVMRANAPNTLLLMFTFQGFNNGGAALNGVNYLTSKGVDWSNAAVAWHGYTSPGAIEDAINAFKASSSNPATLCTEFYNGDTVGQEYNSIFESHFTGWMQFTWLGANDVDLTGFASDIDTAGTVWVPEAGSWPTLGLANIPSNGSSVGVFDRGQNMFVSANGDLRADLATYTGSQNDEFILGRENSTVESCMVSLRASNGNYVSTTGETDALTADAGSVGLDETFQWLELPNNEVVLRSITSGHLVQAATKGRNAGLILPDGHGAADVKTNYKFVDGSTPTGPPPPPGDDPDPDPGPFYGTPMAIPGVIEAEDFDYGGEGVAYHDTDAGNIGGVYRPDEDVDIEACSEGGADVGWIANGEWMNYTVDVQTAGDYTITVREAGGNSSFHIEFDGVDVTGTVPTYETGGWQTWVDIDIPVTLSAGVQVMTFYGNSGFNLNKFTITAGSSSYCGDGTCDPGENSSNCPDDCGGGGACNNDGVCDPGEDCNNCSNDCISKTSGNPNSQYCCGDGTCEGAEDSSNCAVDCGSGPVCGDGTCDAGEDSSNCPEDCGSGGACNSDGICDPGEDCQTCASDCDGETGGRPANRYCCGNGIAEGPEGDGTICDGNY
ncbi:MAG: carbohydrate-binding protein [Anaerohalosphaeraceae bacterium]